MTELEWEKYIQKIAKSMPNPHTGYEKRFFRKRKKTKKNTK